MRKAYKSIFDDNNQLFTIFSFYRICPLGEHADHQHELVFGFANNKDVDFIFSIAEIAISTSIVFHTKVELDLTYHRK